MTRFFFKYRSVIISGLILIAVLIASFTSGTIKDGFLGLATGAALVSFGQNYWRNETEEKGRRTRSTIYETIG